MMTKDNLYHQKIVKPNFLQIKQFYIGDTFTIHLCDKDGLVARGQMVCDGGYALFDRIFVNDSYRRQGLATNMRYAAVTKSRHPSRCNHGAIGGNADG